MQETLEKEVLEEEKSSKHTIFETDLFKEVYSSLKDVEGELREELKGILLNGVKDFIKKEITNTEAINWEAVEIAFFAGISTVLGGDICGEMRRKENLKTNALKRVIRKDNLIGFEILFEGESEMRGGAIMPKEQFEKLVSEGKTTIEIVQDIAKTEKAIKEVRQMSEEDLNKILDLSADKILQKEFCECHIG